MLVRIGTVVESEFGRGPVIAITRQWIIHEAEGNEEIALPYSDVWIPIESADVNIGSITEAEIQ